MTDFEDVFGANEAGKQLRAREFAALQEIAIRTGDAAAQAAILQDVAQAGLVRYVRAARRELAEVYALDDRNPDDVLADLRAMVTPPLEDSQPTDPGVEDYSHGDLEDGEKYHAGAWFDDDKPEQP